MDQFVRGDSTNLPKLDTVMILEYMNSKHNIAEIRAAKTLMSSLDSYVDYAIGYVKVKRNQEECKVSAKVEQKLKVSAEQYKTVNVTINEIDQVIIEATCNGCAAFADGCKDILMFLFWLEKRNSEPVSSSVQCYWKKPILSDLLLSDTIKCEEIFPQSNKIKLVPKDSSVLTKFLDECKKHNVTESLATCFTNPTQCYNLFDEEFESSCTLKIEYSDDDT